MTYSKVMLNEATQLSDGLKDGKVRLSQEMKIINEEKDRFVCSLLGERFDRLFEGCNCVLERTMLAEWGRLLNWREIHIALVSLHLPEYFGLI